MHTQYSQTWREVNINPADLILTNFDNAHENVDTKKVIIQVAVSFCLFILFAYSLSWVDARAAANKEDSQVYGVSTQVKDISTDNMYEYFYQGYVGPTVMDNYEYKVEIKSKLDRIMRMENLI